MKNWIHFLLLGCGVAASLSAAPAEVRTWTETATGRSLEAEMVSSEGGSVTLRRASDGRRFTLPLADLSDADRQFVETAQAGGAGSALPHADADRFEDLSWDSPDEIPADGETGPRFAPLDEAILAFMADKGIGALVAAVSREGEVVYDRAFGFQDSKLKVPIQAGTSMRLASITKPITAAVVKTLLRDGKLKPDDKVFDLLALASEAPAGFDKRWKDVTVDHLLKHEGGWDRAISGDPLFKAPEIAKATGVDLDELTFDEVLAWMLERELDFDPGSRDAYSNFGYTLLAKTAAAVSEKTWEELVNATAGAEAGMTTLVVSPTELENRAAGESWYHYHPEYTKDPGTLPFRTEISYGSGSLACNAADLCQFLEAFWISGEPRDGGSYRYNFFGSMPGTTSVSGQRSDGTSFAAITNRRDRSGSSWNDDLKKAIDAALDEIDW